MKKLLVLPLLLMLSACVTYYDPGSSLEHGYYVEDAPSYVDSAYRYTDTTYYPWSSLDYFYLGGDSYPGYGYGYDGYGYGGFSIGVAYGYSPWSYPYYSNYSPWYGSYYSHNYRPYYPGRWSHHGYCSYANACGHRRNRHQHGDGRQVHFAGVDGRDRHPRGNEEDGNEDPGGRHHGGSNRPGDHGEAPVRRYVSTAPAGSPGNRGVVIRNRGNAKPGKSRLEPVQKVPKPSVSAPTTRRPVAPTYRARRGASETRYRTDTKQGRSHIQPVRSVAPTKSAGTKRPVRSTTMNARARQGASETRHGGADRHSRSHTRPVKSTSHSSAKPSGRRQPDT